MQMLLFFDRFLVLRQVIQEIFIPAILAMMFSIPSDSEGQI